MIKTLTRHGNSLALILDKPILDLLKINGDTPLEISTDGTGLSIRPASVEQRAVRFAEAVEETNRRYGSDLKKLAE